MNTFGQWKGTRNGITMDTRLQDIQRLLRELHNGKCWKCSITYMLILFGIMTIPIFLLIHRICKTHRKIIEEYKDHGVIVCGTVTTSSQQNYCQTGSKLQWRIASLQYNCTNPADGETRRVTKKSDLTFNNDSRVQTGMEIVTLPESALSGQLVSCMQHYYDAPSKFSIFHLFQYYEVFKNVIVNLVASIMYGVMATEPFETFYVVFSTFVLMVYLYFCFGQAPQRIGCDGILIKSAGLLLRDQWNVWNRVFLPYLHLNDVAVEKDP